MGDFNMLPLPVELLVTNSVEQNKTGQSNAEKFCVI
jgi:hypothetical protein